MVGVVGSSPIAPTKLISRPRPNAVIGGFFALAWSISRFLVVVSVVLGVVPPHRVCCSGANVVAGAHLGPSDFLGLELGHFPKQPFLEGACSRVRVGAVGSDHIVGFLQR